MEWFDIGSFIGGVIVAIVGFYLGYRYGRSKR